MEDKYIKHHNNIVKLENFKKKIFAIGVVRDLAIEKEATEEEKHQIVDNTRLIRDLIKDVKPESVVVEMCQDRYDEIFYDVVSHPNYDHTLSAIHKILDSGKSERLLSLD